MTTDVRIARIERGLEAPAGSAWERNVAITALADLRAWQEIAERHGRIGQSPWCRGCELTRFPCPDRQAADAALARLDALWGTDVT